MKHHEALDSCSTGVTVVDVGHYYSERVYMKFLADAVRERFPTDYMLAKEDTPIITL
jgi:putative NIF3 family GTP cyclohydrolase 1 type 2